MEKLGIEIKNKMNKKMIFGCFIIGVMIFLYVALISCKGLLPLIREADKIERVG